MWLTLERDGAIKLIRLRRPGRSRGRVLVRVTDAVRCLEAIADRA